MNSVECVSYWAGQQMVLSGDWSGNIFGWSIKALGDRQVNPSFVLQVIIYGIAVYI